MKTLIAYYSRTGTTKNVAEDICKALKCEKEEITDSKKRDGALGYLKCGKEAMKRELPEINKQKYDPKDYDLVVIGTPIWGWNMASLIRTYLSNNEFKNVAFFCTMGGSGDEKTFKEMQEICKKKPKATLTLLTKEVKKTDYKKKVEEFVEKLKK